MYTFSRAHPHRWVKREYGNDRQTHSHTRPLPLRFLQERIDIAKRILLLALLLPAGNRTGHASAHLALKLHRPTARLRTLAAIHSAKVLIGPEGGGVNGFGRSAAARNGLVAAAGLAACVALLRPVDLNDRKTFNKHVISRS